ncbi:MAG: hypothetical protein R3A10_20360 [Caldilineaceae bacterium]
MADEAGDLSAGTLHAATVTQTDDDAFAIEWIELGSSDNDTIYEAIRSLDEQIAAMQ